MKKIPLTLFLLLFAFLIPTAAHARHFFVVIDGKTHKCEVYGSITRCEPY